jgi:acetoacetyl-CoA synthetase
MPGASWFTGSRLNYAAHAVGRDEDLHRVAVIAHSQTREPIQLTFSELRDQVARARAGLLRLGVGPGDLVTAYLPNIPETVIAFLAAASIGAVWAACAPEFGPHSVISRFGVVAPKLLLTIAGYRYGNRVIDRRADVAAIRAGLPTLEHVVHVPYLGGEEDVIPAASAWDALLAESGPLDFAAVPFDHPLFVLFSSGTTGLPKAIKHCHGGILIEHCKNHGLSWDLGPGDRLMWFSTTAWMMWNALVSGLLVRASIVLIDGNPVHPGLDYQWRLAAETRPTIMGASPAFLMACRKADLRPAEDLDLSSLRQLGAAGSPLAPEGFDWVYEQLPSRVLLNNGSGGTDVCTGMVQGGPMLPVYRGEIAGRCLAVDTAAYDLDGQVVIDRLGELVIRSPMPSMPIGFFNDPGDRRYRAAYFEAFAGVWRHGDWIRFTARGSCVITGRSDATLNRGGVRLGTGELYAVIEDLWEITDSLVVHLEDSQGGPGELLLFVVLADGVVLDQPLRDRIAATLRGSLSPRHVPDTIVAVSAIPTTLTAKKLELPVKRILLGAPAEDVASRDALAQPNALDDFVAYASTRRAGEAAGPSSGPK